MRSRGLQSLPRHYWAALFCLAILCWPLAAEETSTLRTEDTGDTGVRFTASTHVLFSNETSTGTESQSATQTLLNETNLRTEYGQYQLGVDFTDRFVPAGAANTTPQMPFAFEKAVAAYEGSEWQVRLGDSHQELGRGIALSLYRDDVFGLDNTLQGAAVHYGPRGLDVTSFAGRVNALHNGVALNPVLSPVQNEQMYLAGGEVKVDVVRDTKIGAHYLFAADQKDADDHLDQSWNIAGALLQSDGIFDNIDAYLETNAMFSQTLGPGGSPIPTGYGNYGSLVYSAQPWKLKAEVKDYRAFSFDLNRPPTLEEDVVETINTTAVTATRLYAERRIGDNPKNLVHASILYGWDGNYLSQIHHGVVGGKFEGPWGSEIEWKGGYRWEPGYETLYHGTLKGKVRTGKGESLEIGYRKFYHNYNLSTLPTLDDRNYVDIAYVFSERWGLQAGYEYVPSDPDNPNYVNVGATVKLGTFSGRAFIGETSAGLLCSGGVCREIPAYTGAYVDGTYVF